MGGNGKKHILIWSIHFYPEMIGIGVFNYGLARFLSGKYEVTVSTAFPWYPYWKVMDGYRGRLFMTEEIEGVNVRRSFVCPPEKVTSIKRILHEIIFSISSSLSMLPVLFKKVDVMFVVCPPLEIGLIAYLFSRLKRVPFIYHVQDLQVDAAFDIGMLRNRTLFRLLSAIERFIFRKADVLTTISGGMKKRMEGKGIDAGRISLLPNWIDTDYIRPMERTGRFREEFGIGADRFIVLYAGNIGEKQGVDIIIECASRTRDKKDILYVIAGEGANRAKLKAMADEMSLDNIMVLPLQPAGMLPHMLASADISLIIQKKTVGDIVMPSKLLNIMASARPVIATAQSGCELASFIKNADCGIVIEPGEPELLKEAILKLYGDPHLRKRYSANARAYAEEKLSMERILGDFEVTLQNLLTGTASRPRSLALGARERISTDKDLT